MIKRVIGSEGGIKVIYRVVLVSPNREYGDDGCREVVEDPVKI
jgi:hypothetical protein